MKKDQRARRVKRKLEQWNKKFINKFKLDVFFKGAHKTKEVHPTQDPAKSNKQRLIERRIKTGRLGKKR